LPERHCVCPSQWHSWGDVAKGTGLRLGHDLLETPARLAGIWYLAIDSLCAIGLAWPLQSDRLVPSRRGQLLCSSGFLGQQTGPNPTDRAKLGSKRHLIRDGNGVPLAIQLTGANRNDSQQAIALVDAIPFLQGERGRPRNRPDCVIGDRGYDAEAIRQSLRFRGIRPMLAKRNTEYGSGLGRSRWVIERTFAWLSQFRRLRVRYEKRADIHEALLSLGCALISWNFLRAAWISS
jgi:transposase